MESVRDEIHRRRARLDGFDIAVICPAVPEPPELEAYDSAGATWMIVTGWVDALRHTIDAGPFH